MKKADWEYKMDDERHKIIFTSPPDKQGNQIRMNIPNDKSFWSKIKCL